MTRPRPGTAARTGVGLLTAGLCACGTAPSSTGPAVVEEPLRAQTAWRPLLNGTDLGGWTTWLPSRGRGSDPDGYFRVEDGALHVLDVPVTAGERDFGYVVTTTAHADYRLRLQYRWGDKTFAPRARDPRDAGLLYHVTGPDGVWPTSTEFQIMEEHTGDLWALNGVNFSSTVRDGRDGDPRFDPLGRALTTAFPAGSYKRLERAVDVPEDPDGWNDVELIVSGADAVQIVRGQVTARVTDLRAPDGSPLRAGHIALQAEGAEVYYRNVDLRPLAYLPPPDGATVLLGGSGTGGAWRSRAGGGADWPVVDGVMTVRSTAVRGDAASSNDVRSAQGFGDAHVHVEFRVPDSPASGAEQDRGNSGIYVQGRYEVQLLDSFGRTPSGQDDAGAVYGVSDPASNAALPAGTWQSCDILFRAARWVDGRKTEDARMTVILNGDVVQDDVRVPDRTVLGDAETPEDGPVVLQDHGAAVQFRNIWVAPLEE